MSFLEPPEGFIIGRWTRRYTSLAGRRPRGIAGIEVEATDFAPRAGAALARHRADSDVLIERQIRHQALQILVLVPEMPQLPGVEI